MEGVKSEQKFPWMILIPHHPIYYTDFPDLRQLIEKKDNWNDCFESIFGRKDVIAAILSELEPIRNSIAHNRHITQDLYDSLVTAHCRLVTAVGRERSTQLLERHTTAPDIVSLLRALATEGAIVRDAMAACRPVAPLDRWQDTRRKWWFDEDYLGLPIEPIRAFFRLAERYSALDRSRGDGYLVERWLQENAFASLAEAFDRSSQSFL